jgi:hypothetical protein
MTGHCMDKVYTFLVAADSFSKSSDTTAVSPPLVYMKTVVEQLSTSQAGFCNGIN